MEHALRTINLDLDRTVNGHEQRGPINVASCIKLASIASSKLSIQAEINDPFSSHWFSHPHRAVPCTLVLKQHGTCNVLQAPCTGANLDSPIATRLFVSSPQNGRGRNQLSEPLALQYATRRFPTIHSVRTFSLNCLSSFCSSAVAVYTPACKFLRVYPYIEPHLILRRVPRYVYEPYDCMSTSGLRFSQNPPLVVPPADTTYRAYRSMVMPG